MRVLDSPEPCAPVCIDMACGQIVLRVADVNAYELHSDGTKSLQAAGLLTVTTRLVKRSPVYVLRVLGADGRPGWELELVGV